ncbi:TrmB family transcriptional regulator [Alsobacter soli]|uniref:TrmB family transcriptional regulator n=1 Tax=Alsobacter soli TaxID=2109933 RepID=UPI0013048476|nr:TrmB family transcriptional regulator [Alsobacter soli]
MAGKLSVSQATGTEATADLRRLGFTDYEARIYVQLVRQSPATAYEISKTTGVPRPNAYQALEALAQRGAVLPVSENPIRYVAADPKQLFDAIARQTRNLCTDLADQLSALTPPLEDQYVWTLRGEASVHDKIDTLIREAQSVLWIKAADEVLRRHKAALQEAADRGVEALIVLFGPDADEFRFNERWRVYIHEGNGVRMGSADNLFTVAVDHAQMLTARLDQEVVAAHTRNKPIVTLAQSLVRHDYYMAEIFARFGPQIEAAFGLHLRDLRMACFSPAEIRSFQERTGLG